MRILSVITRTTLLIGVQVSAAGYYCERVRLDRAGFDLFEAVGFLAT